MKALSTPWMLIAMSVDYMDESITGLSRAKFETKKLRSTAEVGNFKIHMFKP
jgi:hypothetical protein